MCAVMAGTSARLQPAQVQVHWDKGSLRDLLPVVTGNDLGVRGEFGLDGTASVGMAEAGETNRYWGSGNMKCRRAQHKYIDGI